MPRDTESLAIDLNRPVGHPAHNSLQGIGLHVQDSARCSTYLGQRYRQHHAMTQYERNNSMARVSSLAKGAWGEVTHPRRKKFVEKSSGKSGKKIKKY